MRCIDCGKTETARDPHSQLRCNSCYWTHKRMLPGRKERWRREYNETIEKMRRGKSDGGTK